MYPFTSPVTLTAPSVSITVAALIDSRSAGNFIAGHLARRLGIKTTRTELRNQVQSVTGKPLSDQDVQRRAGPVHLRVGQCHEEDIWFLVLEGSTMDVVLGRPWLARHDPILSWGSGEILKWGPHCWPECFPSLPLRSPRSLQVCTTSIESPVERQSVVIPPDYCAFQDVFCPRRAARLPPHRPWDCAIDLLPDAPVPKGRIYPLLIPENQAMEEYIKEALQHGYIHPSTSPAASSFFFVAKKDGGLRPCIDYRALNKVTIPFKYPLPLVPSALEKLRGAKIFTKLDLRSAYNLVRIRHGDEWKTAFITPTGHYEYLVMLYGLVNAPSIFRDFMHEIFREYLHKFLVIYIDDILIYSSSLQEHRQHVHKVLTKLREHQLFLKAEKCSFHQPSTQFLGYNIDQSGISMDQGKIEAITNWPVPTSIKELQRFLGFSNFYRRFIDKYSDVTSPLTSLLKGKPKTLLWNPESSRAFHELKTAFTSAPILIHPDPEKPFVVEVDASTTGVGAVLSQQQGNPPQLKPCAYFSQKLTPAERNYDIGNRELLAIKLALEKWRHWLEGSVHPFQIQIYHLLSTWPRMEQDVQRYVRGCRECAISKTPKHLPSGKLLPLPTPNRPWSHLGVDFITDLPASGGNTCILVIVDRFSKFCRLIPLKGLTTAWETAQLLFNHVFRPYGLPEDIVSDRGPQFISRVWRAFFRLLGVTVSLSSGYHPQTNEQTERKIQKVGQFLRTFCHGHQSTWNQYLGWAEYAQNSLRQATTGLTPFQCILGFQPPLFPWSGEPSDVPAVDYWFRESERVWDEAHQHLQKAVRRQKTHADSRRSEAPVYQVVEQINPVTYRLQLPPHYRIHPTFHVSLLKPFHDPLLVSTEPGEEEPPPPIVVEEGTIYKVKEILDSRRRGGKLEYLLDWEGYGPEERSWDPREDVLDDTLLKEFHETHPHRPAPRGRGRPPRRRRGLASGGDPGGGGNVTSTPGSTLTSQRSQSPDGCYTYLLPYLLSPSVLLDPPCFSKSSESPPRPRLVSGVCVCVVVVISSAILQFVILLQWKRLFKRPKVWVVPLIRSLPDVAFY
ncbi:Transposon Tf2-6 polyprotein [Labeo rohita]|uniref:ribonuclease H n=1 Tax=Labeo rohita TaxID=84645 RepID=A0ABQ8MVF2_LABRO|nr:Transposon Tf2-6 polyprotein [Labeo rohita]